MEQKYEKMKQRVEAELSCSAHDMEHVLRVTDMCLYLAQGESVDLDVLKSAALLHDIARVKEDEDKFRETDHALLGAKMAEEILKELCYPEEKRERIKHCIAAHRFRSSCTPQTREAQILFDADKLDVLGAVGVGRSFMVAGKYNERVYVDTPLDAYLRENAVGGTRLGRIKDFRKHAPNIEFETKFKHIPDVLYTAKARKIAKERIDFMENFFEQLRKETGEMRIMTSIH
ncbi:MAG: HD domain-containing protein [Theionarchaea archaeon]|nr:HD domain-containing protein [Theionarchaea archaeon]MBU7020360.1 HD domain-containing protein [Theionarchaea archaeon]MBU7035801.1 HD domain-containing protein [Theionarchaea archaeon]MBU7041375.1 HD domain-containing protein [Theionarchaea archaeon]